MGLNFLNVLALAVDSAMCGRLPDAERVLTGVGYASQLVFFLLVAMMGLTVGTVALVARANGAGDKERVNHILLQASQLTAILGIIVAIVGNIFAPQLLALMQATPEGTEAALEYLRPLLLGSIFYYLNILYGAVLRGVQNTMIPFLVALATNIINVCLNYCLILGNFGFPQLGAQGAAIGTAIAYFFGVVIMMLVLHREVVPKICLRLKPKAIDRQLARDMIRIGWPAAMDMLVLNVGFLSIIGMLGDLDEVAVAGHGIGLRIQALAFVPGLGVAQATAAMVGNALGANDATRARQVARASMGICTAIMTLLSLLIIALVYPVVGAFAVPSGTAFEAYSVEWIRILGFGMPIVGPHIALVGVYQGSGATHISLRINMAGTAIQILLSAVLGYALVMGVTGVWLGFPLSFFAKLGISTLVYRRGNWARTGARI
jgi:putative MATE family efflux protein